MLTQNDLQQIKGIVNDVVQQETRKIVREETKNIIKEELKPISKKINKIEKDLHMVIDHFDKRIAKNSKDIVELQQHLGVSPQ